MREERERKKTLQKGGGAAAHILAKEDAIRLKLQKTKGGLDVSVGSNPAEVPSMINEPGAASLAASFSCLHPTIDGVEALMHVSIATAGCAVSVQQMIALNCLLACYNLATLYRDGF